MQNEIILQILERINFYRNIFFHYIKKETKKELHKKIQKKNCVTFYFTLILFFCFIMNFWLNSGERNEKRFTLIMWMCFRIVFVFCLSLPLPFFLVYLSRCSWFDEQLRGKFI